MNVGKIPKSYIAPGELQIALISMHGPWLKMTIFPGVHRRELFSIYGMRNELQRHCRILKVSLIDGMINDRTLESMAMDRVIEMPAIEA